MYLTSNTKWTHEVVFINLFIYASTYVIIPKVAMSLRGIGGKRKGNMRSVGEKKENERNGVLYLYFKIKSF